MPTCKNAAKYHYTWPGRGRALICEEHSIKLLAVANAMGVAPFVHLTPLKIKPNQDSQLCEQQVSKKELNNG